MTNLSSLPKLHFANYAHIGVVVLGLIISAIFLDFHWITLFFGLANIAIALYAYRQIKSTTKTLRDTVDLVQEAINGNFEGR